MAASVMTATDTPEYIILKDHLADVVDLLAGNAPVITQFSNHLFSSNLIPKEVHLNPKSSPLDRATQLINSVSFIIRTHSNPSDVFRGLVTSLEKVGLTDMAKKLQQSLGGGSHFQALVPLVEAVDQSPTVIQLSSKDEVATNIDKLYDQFTSLVTDLRTRFEELISEGTIELKKVTRQAGDYLGRRVTSLQADSIDELFDCLRSHYDFLNCSLLTKLTNRFLAGDELQLSVSQYIDSMDNLLKLSQLKHIRSTIKEKLSFLPTNEHVACIVFKLHDRWEEMTLKNFKRVLIHYFGSNADLFSHIDFDYGSVVIKMLVPTSILQFVTDRLIAGRSSMNRIGIFEVAINGRTMLSIDDADINFEKSLMDSDDFEATMLLKLGANPSCKDDATSIAIREALEEYYIPLQLSRGRLAITTGDQPDTSSGELQLHVLPRATSSENESNVVYFPVTRLDNRLFLTLDLPQAFRLFPGFIRILLPYIIRYPRLSIASATIFGGICGMAVSKLMIKICGDMGTRFVMYIAVEALATTLFDIGRGHSSRVSRYRIVMDVACALLAIGIPLIFCYDAIRIYFIMKESLVYDTEYSGVSILQGAILGAVSSLIVGREPLIGQLLSGKNKSQSTYSVGFIMFRTCIGMACGALIGSVALSTLSPYEHTRTGMIFMGGLTAAFIGCKNCSYIASIFL